MKRAPIKQRLALVLDGAGDIAGLADDRRTWTRVEVFEPGADETTTITAESEESYDLADMIDEMGITDLVAEYYEDGIFGALKGEGFNLWLAPPQTSEHEAIDEWRENVLTPAQAGVEVMRRGHRLHGPPIERRERL